MVVCCTSLLFIFFPILLFKWFFAKLLSKWLFAKLLFKWLFPYEIPTKKFEETNLRKLLYKQAFFTAWQAKI